MSGYADVQDPASVLNNSAQDRPYRQTTRELVEAAGWRLRSVNWVYEKVAGEDLVESLVQPLLGDFDKIDQNAAAWDGVAKALDAVRNNLNAGLQQLEPHWDGQAAQSFERHISVVWTVGIEADSQLANLIGGRFKNMADTCRNMCSLALKQLDKLIGILMDAAVKAAFPPAWMTVVKMVKNAIDLVDAIRKIIINVRQLIEGVKAMVDGVVAMGTALARIKDVRSVNDAANVLDETQQGKGQFDDGKQAAAQGAKDAARGAFSAVRAGIRLRGEINGFTANRVAPAGGGPGPGGGA
ncbi:hypothetical protein LZ318_19180 [Saccharopolyspora indica]|uniref:WXG100 family type VII secretion target n=1 Tax=Saccharopolyspora indica TaxID=1229659 RepID=UPI0022EAC169|nr:hypothetical protein [Saccharopolyspora indica]MDA3643162.1 hypothetical protein [Saccharopolyspora indica]